MRKWFRRWFLHQVVEPYIQHLWSPENFDEIVKVDKYHGVIVVTSRRGVFVLSDDPSSLWNWKIQQESHR